MKHTTLALLLAACCTLLLGACGKTETARSALRGLLKAPTPFTTS